MTTQTIRHEPVQEIRFAWDCPQVQDLLLKYWQDRLFGTPASAARDVDHITIQPGAEVLDVGCGLGYHAVEFARRGCNVTAFDPGDRYIDRAREYADRAGIHIHWRIMKCEDLSAVERFDLAWLGNYCPGQMTPEQVRDDFKWIWLALKPGGHFIGSLAGAVKQPPSPRIRAWSRLRDGYVLTEKWRDDTFRHEHCWFIDPDQGRAIKVVEVQRMFDAAEFESFLKDAGFVDVELFAGLDDPQPPRPGMPFAFRARRPETRLFDTSAEYPAQFTFEAENP